MGTPSRVSGICLCRGSLGLVMKEASIDPDGLQEPDMAVLINWGGGSHFRALI